MTNPVKNSARLLSAGLRALLVLTLATGVLYPLTVTAVAQLAFPDRANGSPVRSGGRVVGSELVGQRYDLPPEKGTAREQPSAADPRWFQPRPSGGLTDAGGGGRVEIPVSGATNLSGDNPELSRRVREARRAVARENSVPGHRIAPRDVPADAVTSSGSGLDPHISPKYAALQVPRVARRNGLPTARVRALVESGTEGRQLGFLGEPRVNVLRLNVALKELREAAARG